MQFLGNDVEGGWCACNLLTFSFCLLYWLKFFFLNKILLMKLSLF